MKNLVTEAIVIIVGEVICICLGIADMMAYGVRLMSVSVIPLEINNFWATVIWFAVLVISCIVLGAELKDYKLNKKGEIK